MNKEGSVKNNEFSVLYLVAVALVFSIFFIGFMGAGTIIGVLNITNQSNGQVNASFNIINGSEKLAKVNEDIMCGYNLSISHIAATRNLTGINITLPASFAFAVGSNRTGNTTSSSSIFFNATSSSGNFNGSTLSWNASTGITTATGWIVNHSGFNNYTYIMFNATAATPGYYNITVRFIYNHTIINAALGYNETNMTILVNDTTAPWQVNVSGGHTFGLNRSYANVSGSITINLSAFDNGNLTAGLREYDVTGVNITIYNNTAGVNASYIASNVTGKYWNYTLDTTKFPDGVYNISIFVNDTNGNVNSTNISNLRIDNTVPTGSVSCTPATVNTGDVVTCTCSPSDVTSGVNSSATSITASPSTANTGTHTISCGFADMAGNTASASDTYTVELSSSSSGGTSTTTSFTYSKTIPQTSADFSEIKTIETSSFGSGGLKVKERVKIKLSEEVHYIGVRELTGTSATIEITSDPVQVKLDIGQDAKVDLNDDGFYDLHVKLNGILGSVADLTILYLHEEIPEGEGGVVTSGEELITEEEEETPEEKSPLTWLWILIGIILLVIVGLAVKKRKQ